MDARRTPNPNVRLVSRMAGSDETTPLDQSGGVLGSGDLLLVAGDGQFSTHELRGGDVVIGRGEGCDVVIDHRSLSRRHAVFRLGPPATVQDLGSTNGTFVAGAIRQGGDPVPLRRGDGFRIGPFSFVIVGRAGVEKSMSLTGKDLLRVIDPSPSAIPGMVRDFAASPASVLILGETGVGKEVLASTIHGISSRPGVMSRINCAALSESLLESELFGHEKGAFTGAAAQKIGLIEAANGGTVFLDEIGEMPLSIQAKLLRAVEHREVLRLGATKPISIDVRFIAATNRDLPSEVAAGRFRRDLYFRLDGVTLVIPPLRERRGLIGPLALRFLEAAGKQRAKLPADVLTALEEYSWPGNVRELKAVMERATVLARGGDVSLKHLTFARRGDSVPPSSRAATDPGIAGYAPAPSSSPPMMPASAAPAAGGEAVGFLDEEQRADRERVLRALEECAGNQTRAAKKLGISRTAFVTKLRIYRIPRPRA
jgi:two-component system, NtrC family, response regulator AtoC